MAHAFVFSLSLQGTGLGEGDGEDHHWEITPFGTWLLSLCNGSGEAGLWERRGDGQNKQVFAFSLFYQSKVGRLGVASRSGLNTHTGWGQEDKTCFKALIKTQAVFPSGQRGITSLSVVASHLWASWHHIYLGAAWHHISRAYVCRCCVPSKAVFSPWPPPSTPRGRDPAVRFSLSAYRNQKLPSCPFLLAENRLLREGPVRAGRTSGPCNPLLAGSCCSPGYF